MQEMQVQKKKKKERDAGSILGSEEALEKHSSFLGWEISWTEEPGALQSMGLQRVDMTQ